MKIGLTIAGIALASLFVGYSTGQLQRAPVAASPAASLEVDPHADHPLGAVATGAIQAPSQKNLPPSSEGGKARLNNSPRHGELAKTTVRGTPLNLWASYPERPDKAPVVVVIHGASGFDDWVRSVADQLAADGFIGIVPDLLTGRGPNNGSTEAFSGRDEVSKAIQLLTREEIVARLHAVRDYAMKLPAASSKTAVIAFCFGGSQAFMYATQQPALNAAVVFYGSAPAQTLTPSGAGTAPTSFVPAADMLVNINAPVLGLYGGADARINATIPATEAKMKELGKVYEPHIFKGAGHAFLSAQSGQNGSNMQAPERAWPLMIAFLRKHLDGETP